MLNFLKNWVLVISMLLGIILNRHLIELAPIIPYLISIMLFITFSKVNFSQLRVSRMHLVMFVVQIVAAVSVYLVIEPFSETVAQGAMICVLVPTATAASVVVGILGGSVSSIAVYTLFNSVASALLIPVIFSALGTAQELSFFESLMIICKSVLPMFFVPLAIACVINNSLPKMRKAVERLLPLSFYIWAFALMIVTGRTVHSIIHESDSAGIWQEVVLATVAVVICVSQYAVGKKIGHRYGRVVEAGQGMGQKNTIFGIWLTHTYFTPQAALAPACYVIWQNMANTYEIWKSRRKLKS